MARSVHTYEGRGVRVHYDKKRCIHAAECVKRLPSVFDPKARPWTRPDEAEVDEVVRTVSACPSGALQTDRLDGGAAEAVPGETTLRVEENGPLVVHGPVRVVTKAGERIAESRLTLCRCGLSSNKPFCDGAHAKGFVASSVVEVAAPDGVAEGAGVVEITVAPGGPLLVSGPFRWRGADGNDSPRCDRTALCRCGASARKPFCDGAHKAVDFDPS